MTNVATVNELITALLNAQTATAPVTLTLTASNYDLSTWIGTRDARFGTGTLVAGLPHITKNVTIVAASSASTITRTGAKLRHFYVAAGASLTLTSIQLTNGDVDLLDSGGGAIYNEGILTVRHCRFRTNKSNYGGAILNFRGRTDIFNCLVEDNQADWGGGLYNYLLSNNCVMNIVDSRIASNRANESSARGGGIVNLGTLTLQHCMIISNTAQGVGGGILNWDTNPQATVTDSHIVSNNSQISGGGIYNQTGSMRLERCTLARNSAPNGSDSQRVAGSITLARCSLSDNFETRALSVTLDPNIPPRPEWCPDFILSGTSQLTPAYQYNRYMAAERATVISKTNFLAFPTIGVANVLGYVDRQNTIRRPRKYADTLLSHRTQDNATGSSIFISEMLHYGGMPMTNALNPPFCEGDDLNISGAYTLRGWRYCSQQLISNINWKYHPGIMQFFSSLPSGARIGGVTPSEIQGFIWTDAPGGLITRRNESGMLKPNSQSNQNALIARFAPGGNLTSIGIGDYVFIDSHGFLIVGWGPLYDTITGITHGLNTQLATARSATNPIPYIADFCFGTDATNSNPNGTDEGTGWLQDPRPRPFYAAATFVYEMNLRAEQKTYLRKIQLSGVFQPVYQPFLLSASFQRYDFYKMPDSIALNNVPFSRMVFDQ
jgi:diadenosine tetraphosphatase ApaH/serine/threonine PP2A family protein phosphatase